MLKVGQEEVDAVARVVRSGKVFRYDDDGECGKFERRYGEFLGVRHVTLCASGTAALTAALGGLGIGPGDEVVVPSHTYMATPIAVLAVGAIPIIVEIDDSITMDPDAFRQSIGPRTRAHWIRWSATRWRRRCRRHRIEHRRRLRIAHARYWWYRCYYHRGVGQYRWCRDNGHRRGQWDIRELCDRCTSWYRIHTQRSSGHCGDRGR